MAKVRNPKHGMVEISIDKERNYLDIGKHDRVYLWFNYNAIAIVDREMKQYGSSVLFLFMNPTLVGTEDVRILLAAGLKHQFPGITFDIAGQIMDFEKFTDVLKKEMEALSYAMEGWFEGEAQEDVKNMRLRAVAIDGTETEEASAESAEEGGKGKK